MSFTCTQPSANMQEVTTARSTDDQENKDKSADFADRLFSYRVSTKKYPISSVQHVCGVLMKTASAAISEAAIFSIIKWINKRTKQKYYFTFLEAVSQLSIACFPSVYT